MDLGSSTAELTANDHEKKRSAEKLHQRLIDALETMALNERNLVGTIAKLFGAPTETHRERVIWHGLVALANTRLVRNGAELGLIYIKATILLCGWRLAGELTNLTEDLSCFRDIESEAEVSGKGLDEALTARIPSIQNQVGTLLSWLANPTACGPTASREALRLLLQHRSEGAIDFDIELNDNFDDTGNKGYPLYYWKNIFGYESLITPITKFIFDQLEQYHSGELALDKAVPVIVCKRQGCGKFAVPRRRTKEFCSDSCRTLYRQKINAKDYAAYMRKYRAENY